MNLNQLKAFVKVVQTGSFKEAARHLSVSQPAITQRIQALEECLKTKLFAKESEGLTSHGKILFERSIEMLSIWDQVENEILGTKVCGQLNLGASTIPSEYIIPPILKTYRSVYPDVRLRLRVSGTSEVIRWLRDRAIDVAVTGEPVLGGDGMESFAIAKDQLRLIAPVDFEVCQTCSLDQLLKEDWILREPQSDTRRSFESFLVDAGIDVGQLSVAGQLESTEAVIAAVEAGLGLSVVSSLSAERAEKLGQVRMIWLPNFTIQRKFYCSYLRDQCNQSVVSTFIHFIEKSKL